MRSRCFDAASAFACISANKWQFVCAYYPRRSAFCESFHCLHPEIDQPKSICFGLLHCANGKIAHRVEDRLKQKSYSEQNEK